MDLSVKKILKRIYEFDFTNCNVPNKREFYTDSRGISEFNETFRKNDLDNGIILTPSGYTVGLFYSSANDGEIYSSPRYNPDIVTFNFHIYGLKRGAFYRVTVPARSAGSGTIITDDRTLKLVDGSQNLILDEDFTSVTLENKIVNGVFRAESTEVDLLFSVGKIIISDIIIDEIELIEETPEEESEDKANIVLENGKYRLIAYGTYNLKAVYPDSFTGRYLPVTKYSGVGINIYYDKIEDCYVIERDNAEDVIGTSFTSMEYVLDLNFNKTAQDVFNTYRIKTVSVDPAPNTLKQGFIKFEMVDYSGNKVNVSRMDVRMSLIIHKIY